jgi:hypothetical protein
MPFLISTGSATRNIPGANEADYTIASASRYVNGREFSCGCFHNAFGTVTSNEAT